MAVKDASKNKSAGSSRALRKVLIVDDEPLICLGLERLLAKEGYPSISVGTGETALNRLEEENDLFLVLLDLKLPGSYDGLSLLEIIKKSRPGITVIMISGQSEIRAAVEAMKLGALDYLEKPIDLDRLKNLLASVEQKVLEKESSMELQRILSPMDELACASAKMKKVFDLMQRFASKSDITILLMGESGAGKHFLCRKLHEMSPRRDFPFKRICCSNVSGHRIESELFGYEKGALADAENARQGLVDIADGGTILLEEPEEMPYPFQIKILRLLEEKLFRRLGSLNDTRADVRILATTNRNLHNLVQRKKFRLDLYCRLNTAYIEVPPLRDRPEFELRNRRVIRVKAL